MRSCDQSALAHRQRLAALFRTDEYTDLPILAEKAGKTGCIKYATVVRKADGEGTECPEPVQDVSGPGTALMELDLLCINSGG
ncbi:hypothetical protein [Streptomyces atratus]|uniref:hypothetical protein n=1 Tax=Streptomyces atratus TaxID=1893 RepID=UPI0022507912|nr:hypothetical protein [Streptomyces atratus]MCX5338678.1 hypothetical protein [Streptomyces atratus]